MTITLQAVNELIASLESAGELSIREQKFLKLAKAFKQLAAENVALKDTNDDRRMFIMSGVQLGYIKLPADETGPAIETIRIAVSPQKPTPATDRIYAWVKADGVDEFAESQKEYVRQHRNEMDQMLRAAYAGSAVDAERFAKQLREDAA